MSLLPAWPGAVYAEHQEEGIQWMLAQEKQGYTIINANTNKDCIIRGGILGDEMGLGKTIQALALIANSTVMSTLIVTPLAVRKQWEDALMRMKNINVYTAETTWQAQGKLLPSRKSVFLAHYDKVVSNPQIFLDDMDFDRIILDEAHRIRNMKNVTSTTVLKIKAVYKWALTATPIVNSLDDAVAYLKFIGFPAANSWNPSYEIWVRNCYMARTLDQCEAPAGLTMPPPPILETRYLDFANKEEEQIYSGIYSNLENQWRQAAYQGRAGALQKLSILLRLRQVSVNPQVYIRARQKEPFGWAGPEFTAVSRKFAEIKTLLQASKEEGVSNRWIIFCQFHEEIVMLTEFLKGLDTIGSVLQYHGGMSLKQRDEAIAASHVKTLGKQDVFLIQLQAGGTGLNLQHYDRVIFTSPWWTAALLDQALGRAVRIGQVNVVKVYWLKLKTEDLFNIDAFILDKADSKRDLGKLFLSWAI